MRSAVRSLCIVAVVAAVAFACGSSDNSEFGEVGPGGEEGGSTTPPIGSIAPPTDGGANDGNSSCVPQTSRPRRRTADPSATAAVASCSAERAGPTTRAVAAAWRARAEGPRAPRRRAPISARTAEPSVTAAAGSSRRAVRAMPASAAVAGRANAEGEWATAACACPRRRHALQATAAPSQTVAA